MYNTFILVNEIRNGVPRRRIVNTANILDVIEEENGCTIFLRDFHHDGRTVQVSESLASFETMLKTRDADTTDF